MLDIKQALRTLKRVSEIHVISVKGECKELLFVQDTSANQENQSIEVYCQNLGTQEAPLVGRFNALTNTTEIYAKIIDKKKDDAVSLIDNIM